MKSAGLCGDVLLSPANIIKRLRNMNLKDLKNDSLVVGTSD